MTEFRDTLTATLEDALSLYSSVRDIENLADYLIDSGAVVDPAHVNHEVQPVIGMLRKKLDDDTLVDLVNVKWAINRLYRAIGKENPTPELGNNND